MGTLSLYAASASTLGSWANIEFAPDVPDTGETTNTLASGNGDLDLTLNYSSLASIGAGVITGIQVTAYMSQTSNMVSIWQLGYADSYIGNYKIVTGSVSGTATLGGPGDTWSLSASELQTIKAAPIGNGFQVNIAPQNEGVGSGTTGIDAVQVTFYYSSGGFRTRTFRTCYGRGR